MSSVTRPAAELGEGPPGAGIIEALIKQRGDRRWDVLIRVTGAVALLGIPVALLVPNSIALVWLAVLAIPANGPLSPILPTTFEPLVIEAAKYNAMLVVTVVAVCCSLYMEYLNWHLYGWVLNWEKFAALRSHRWVTWGIEHFAKAPFSTTIIFAFAPVPFWVVRCLGILHGYSVRKYLTATAIGRFPRLYLWAWLGSAVQPPTSVLLAVAFGTFVIIVAWRLIRGRPILEDTVFDMAPEGPDGQSDTSPRALPAGDTIGVSEEISNA